MVHRPTIIRGLFRKWGRVVQVSAIVTNTAKSDAIAKLINGQLFNYNIRLVSISFCFVVMRKPESGISFTACLTKTLSLDYWLENI